MLAYFTKRRGEMQRTVEDVLRSRGSRPLAGLVSGRPAVAFSMKAICSGEMRTSRLATYGSERRQFHGKTKGSVA